MDRKKMKIFLKKNEKFTLACFYIFNHIPFNNKIKCNKSNTIINGGILKNCVIRIEGSKNSIFIEPWVRLNNTNITVKGNGNTIIIGENCLINDGDLYIEDDYGKISIGKNTEICGRTHLAVIEGMAIEIGENCLFSSSIVVRTGDSHSILNFEGERINPSKSVKIGNRVWIGNQVIILKGVEINDDSVIGTGSVVTKTYDISNVIIAGSPAKVIKENITWDGIRL